jgi:hypothetical protein
MCWSPPAKTAIVLNPASKAGLVRYGIDSSSQPTDYKCIWNQLSKFIYQSFGLLSSVTGTGP